MTETSPESEVLRKLAAFLERLSPESYVCWYRGGGEWVKDREAQDALEQLRDAFLATRRPDA
jgi:hypothetical protein